MFNLDNYKMKFLSLSGNKPVIKNQQQVFKDCLQYFLQTNKRKQTYLVEKVVDKSFVQWRLEDNIGLWQFQTYLEKYAIHYLFVYKYNPVNNYK